MKWMILLCFALVSGNSCWSQEIMHNSENNMYEFEGKEYKLMELDKVLSSHPDAYDIYSRGKERRELGVQLRTVGAVAGLTGLTISLAPVLLNTEGKSADINLLSAPSILAMGGLFVGALGATRIALSEDKMKAGVDIYNEESSNGKIGMEVKQYLDINAGPLGIGLTYHF